MGGLISDWKMFADNINSINRPFQMGPLWAHAAQVSGMPIDDKIWIVNPPATSYLACVAVKCAGLQNFDAQERYLRKVREAVMLHRGNVAKKEILFDLASELGKENKKVFDVDVFVKDFYSGKGTAAFKSDLQEVQYKRVERFPSLVIKTADIKPAISIGYSSYQQLLNVIEPVITISNAAVNKEEYTKIYGNITDREMKEIL
jgi:putative protein-disulfide isomerase